MQIKKNELHTSVRTGGEQLIISPADWLATTDEHLMEDYPHYKELAIPGLKGTDQVVVTYTGRDRKLAKDCNIDYIEAHDNMMVIYCAETPLENITATLTIIKK